MDDVKDVDVKETTWKNQLERPKKNQLFDVKDTTGKYFINLLHVHVSHIVTYYVSKINNVRIKMLLNWRHKQWKFII